MNNWVTHTRTHSTEFRKLESLRTGENTCKGIRITLNHLKCMQPKKAIIIIAQSLRGTVLSPKNGKSEMKCGSVMMSMAIEPGFSTLKCLEFYCMYKTFSNLWCSLFIIWVVKHQADVEHYFIVRSQNIIFTRANRSVSMSNVE